MLTFKKKLLQKTSKEQREFNEHIYKNCKIVKYFYYSK